MKQYVILADITCDLSPELREYFGVEEYIPGHVTIDDGRDFASRLDWDLISREEFYRILSDHKRKITTAPPNVEEYYAVFEKYAAQGIGVLSMSLSGKISSTYGFACAAAERIRENYPQAEIYCFDSFRMSAAFGLLVACAHDLKRQGKTMDEVIAWLEEHKTCVHQMGPIDDLIFVARRGRITMGKAIMGSFAGVKPMGDCNAEGYTTVLTKAKGIKKALDITVRYLQQTMTDPENSYVIVAHSDRELYGKTLAEMIEMQLKPKKVFLTDLYSGSGANVGPGMVGAYYLGAPITDDLVAEKEIMNRIVGK